MNLRTFITSLFLCMYFQLPGCPELVCDENRECVSMLDCPAAINITRSKDISKREKRKHLEAIQCEFSKNNRRIYLKVCCDRIVKTTPTSKLSCTTPSKVDGICVKLKNESCPFLYELSRTRPLSRAKATILQRSVCAHIETEVLYCCPLAKIPTTMPMTTTEATVDIGDAIVPISKYLPTYGECGMQKSSYEVDILSGSTTYFGEHPWSAIIAMKNISSYNDMICEGVLISRRYVLTTAYCLNELKGKLGVVRLGEYNLRTVKDCTFLGGCGPPPQDILIQKIIIYEAWKSNKANKLHDLGLIRLNQDAKFTEFVKPICLPNKNREILDEMNYNRWISGWKILPNETKDFIEIKKKMKIPSTEFLSCKQRYQNISAQITLQNSFQFCAGGEKGKSSCIGSTVISHFQEKNTNIEKWFITGLLSIHPKDCGNQTGQPNVYVKVNAYINWILNKLEG